VPYFQISDKHFCIAANTILAEGGVACPERDRPGYTIHYYNIQPLLIFIFASAFAMPG
jgi:hypothetical protein